MEKMLHGGDYNPDQWLEYPDILEQDILLMKKANVNCVSLGIFAWTALEPEEGSYQFDWLEAVIHRLYREGIYTILATPTGAMPHWLTSKHEEVMQVNHHLVRNLPGKRHNFCYTSPVMREMTRKIDTSLAKRFGTQEGVILWHISNELGGNFADASCHCPLCQEAFRTWLKEKYRTLDALNAAWWTKFWSHTYTDWSQLHSPVEQGELYLHGLVLDWKRFVTWQMRDFYLEEVKAVKKYSNGLPVTTNMMPFFQYLDYFKFQDAVDIVSWDSYPFWHSATDEIDVAVSNAAFHNVMRSLKKEPFLLMESTPSMTNWADICTPKRPGLHELVSMQAVAHGSNSVQYFQWRKSRGSSEKFHGAVVGHDGTGDTRVFKEVSRVGARLRNITDAIYSTCNEARIAIIFDWENWWAIDEAQGPKKEKAYLQRVLEQYKPFWEMGVDVDFIDMDQRLDGYQLVVAPVLYLLKAPFIDKIKAYVREGGTYVSGYWSNMVDENDLCFLGGSPLDPVFGIRVEEIDAPSVFYQNSVSYKGTYYKTGDLCEVIHADSASVLGRYTDDYYQNTPALTKNTYGLGQAYYIASRNEYRFYQEFYSDRLKELGIERGLGEILPYGVTVTKRVGDDTLYFVQNFNRTTKTIILNREYSILETGEIIANSLVLSPYECIILKSGNNATD